MNRWIPALLLATAALAAQAQTVIRNAPADVKPGRLAITTPPEATLDGQPARLSPGARIRDTNNMLVLSGSLAGQTVPVVYRPDGMGNVHEVWLLTEDEYTQLGGTDGDGQGGARFAELLNMLWRARK
ncbi:hypothetical protein [Ramlibacter humi]|uniref:Uncharacterized protein n=1 Tax=Ramlibacter humi TaxID=2530451 RepID=A0A4Z0BY73_9BURK|nr:hypothetical protein [Ramlibacter humi]TFZ03632.1 hypothetical protein EZ216_08175 [Ramlibacter humi]